MTERYVDPTGTDAAGRGTLNAPWKTLEYAVTNATAGDILVLDGVFSGTNIGASSFLNFTSAKNLSWRSKTPYSGKIAASAANVFIYQDGFGTATHTFGDIVFGGASLGGTDPGTYINWFSVGGGTITNMTDRGGPKFVDPATSAIFYLNKGAGTTKIIVNLAGAIVDTSASTNNWASNTSIINSSLGLAAGSSITFDRLTINVPNAYHSSRLNDINVADSSVPVRITNLSMTAVTRGTTGSRCVGFYIRNSDKAVISGSISMTASAASGTSTSFTGAQIDCDSLTLTAKNALMENLYTYLDGDGGIQQIIGHDSTNAYDGRISNGLITNCTAIGSARYQTGGGHGLMLGWNTNSSISNGVVNTVALGLVIKGCTNSYGIGNKIWNCTGSYLLHKANTSCSYIGNTIYMGGSLGGGVGFYGQADGAVNNATCNIVGNTVNLSGVIGQVFYYDVSQDITAQSNHYFDAGYTAPDPIATNGATPYSPPLSSVLPSFDTNYQLTQGRVSQVSLVQDLRFHITPHLSIPVYG